jgi:hypothetical protein
VGERGARIALLVPAGVLCALMAEAWPVTVDDAFISLRHARHWALFGTPSWDVAQPIEAYSNFLWVAIAAGVLRLGGDPVLAAKILGAAAALGSLVLAFALARRLGAGSGHAWLGAAILSVSTGLGFWAVSGLETALFALLLSCGVWLLAADRASPWFAGPVLLLAALTRVEGPVLVGAAIAARAAVRRAEGVAWRAVAREHAWVAVLGAGYAIYFAWRWDYYGHLFPSPIYFKRIGAAGDVFASHTAVFLAYSTPLLLAAAASPWLAGRRAWIALAPIAAALAVFATARELVLEDVSTMAWFDRYFVPVLPCATAAAAAALAGAHRAAGRAPRRALVALAGAFLLAWQLANPAANPLRLLARSRGYPRAVAARNEPSAQYLVRRFGAAGRVAAGDIGVLGYRFSGAVWDLYGLASYDRTLRHGGELLPYLHELLARAPDAVVLCFTEGAQGREAAAQRGEAERSVGPREDAPEPCLHPERELAALPEFRAHYAPAAEFGHAEVPSDYHVIFARADDAAP